MNFLLLVCLLRPFPTHHDLPPDEWADLLPQRWECQCRLEWIDSRERWLYDVAATHAYLRDDAFGEYYRLERVRKFWSMASIVRTGSVVTEDRYRMLRIMDMIGVDAYLNQEWPEP